MAAGSKGRVEKGLGGPFETLSKCPKVASGSGGKKSVSQGTDHTGSVMAWVGRGGEKRSSVGGKNK